MTRYLVRGNQHRARGKNSVQLAEELRVVFPLRYRPTGRTVGGFPEAEVAGAYRDRVNIVVTAGIDAFGRDVSRDRYYRANYVPVKAAEVKKVIRVLRDQEAKVIDGHRERLRELYAQIDAVEDELDEALRQAFSSGNVVRVAELVERAEEQKRS